MRWEIFGVTIAFVLIFSAPVFAFSGTGANGRVQGFVGLSSGTEIASGNNVTFLGMEQPAGRDTNGSTEGCIGFICPTKPYIRSINVSPPSPVTGSTLDCGINATDTDIEDLLDGNITWYMNNGTGFVRWTSDDENLTIVMGIVANTTDVGDIEPANTSQGQQWKCSITVTDRFHNPITLNSSALTIINAAPLVGIIKTFLGSVETSTFNRLDTVSIKVNVSDADGRSELSEVLITVIDSFPDYQVTNASMTNTTLIPDGYQYEYNYLIPADARGGTWIIDVYANDSNNDFGYNTTTFFVLSPGFNVQFILKINDTTSTVYIPGIGNVDSGSITPAEYTTPPNFFLASELSNILKALVFQERDPLSLIVNSTATSHVLEINQEARNSKVFLVFTQGGAQNIINRIGSVESGGFLKEITPTFGFGLGDKLPLKMFLEYNDIDVGGNVSVLQRGQHKLVFESSKTDSSKSILINQLT